MTLFDLTFPGPLSKITMDDVIGQMTVTIDIYVQNGQASIFGTACLRLLFHGDLL